MSPGDFGPQEASICGTATVPTRTLPATRGARGMQGNQMWDWLPETKQIKNRYGLCMDAPHPRQVNSHVHMWTCRDDLSNQRWHFRDVDSVATTEPGTETTSTSPTGSTSEMSTTSSSSTTSTTTPTPLSAVRNCQLEPLVEGSGCKRLGRFKAEGYGIRENGQETEGRHRCLKKMRRRFPDADSFVHSIGPDSVGDLRTCGDVRIVPA
eukprot:Skav204212  [mRNA]  locus=scaffold4989:6152:13808:+ [translate_table: standard]